MAGAIIALVHVFAQGYLGGRMTYQQTVGVLRGIVSDADFRAINAYLRTLRR